MKSQNTRKLQIFVSGRVHGVGFRRFAQRNAQELMLRGWTRNLLDGRVQILVEGPHEQLDIYCVRLRKGPAFAQVEDLKVVETNETLNSESFLILPDGDPL